jgi:hypothetical protein
MNKIKKVLLAFGAVLLSTLLLCSCSAKKAAMTEGTAPSEIQKCRTRADIISKPSTETVYSEKVKETIVFEVYEVKYKEGSGAKAAINGILAVYTLGVSEIINSRLENSKIDDGAYIIKVQYDDYGNIKKLEKGE